jgi:hypothetical protein
MEIRHSLYNPAGIQHGVFLCILWPIYAHESGFETFEAIHLVKSLQLRPLLTCNLISVVVHK